MGSLITENIKDIRKDWMEKNPVLSQYTSSALLMKVDLILLGLRIEKVLSDTYRIIFECYPLWGTDKNKRNIPLISAEMTDRKRGQYFINFRRHNDLLQDAIECSESQFGPLLKENIDINDLYQFIDVILSQKRSKHNPIDLYRIFELQLALALYYEDTNRHNKIKREIEKEISFWNAKDFSDLFSETIEEWKTELFQRMEDREQFNNQIILNMSDKKILKLKSGHFII